MFHKCLFTLNTVYAYVMSIVKNVRFVAAFLPLLISTSLIMTPNTTTYTALGSITASRSDNGALTDPIKYPLQVHFLGHNFGAINGAFDPGLSLADISPFSYKFAGITVERRSELGPLTGTTDYPLQAHLPGHDFGAIDGASNP